MQAEERKQLEQNTLVQQLEGAYKGLRQGPSRSTIILVACLIAAVVIFLLFRYFISSSSAADSQRWLKLDEVLFPAQLDDYAGQGENKDTQQARLARFKEARMVLSQGLRDFGNSSPETRKASSENLKKAADKYKELATSSSRLPPLLQQEALWGQAKALESWGSSQPVAEARQAYKDARELYEKLEKAYPKSALGKDAKKQIARLASHEQELIELAKEFGPLSK